MPKKTGICINVGGKCPKALSREKQEADVTNFKCKHCSGELREYKGPPPINWKIVIGVGILVLGGGAAALLMGGDTKVETISLNKTVLDGEIGETKILETTISPLDAEYSLVWSSSDEDVANVNNGEIDFVGEGIAVVTVQIQEQPEMRAQCSVTVKKQEPESVDMTEISFAQPSITMKADDTISVVLNILPANADESLVWTSSNEAVAIVMGNVVKGVAPGKATITVESERSHTKAALEVTVEKKVEPTLPSATKSVLGGAATYSSATGIITFLRSTTINLHSRDNEVLHVNRGDKIIGAKVQNGYLIQGEYVDSHGNSQLLTGLNNKLW